MLDPAAGRGVPGGMSGYGRRKWRCMGRPGTEKRRSRSARAVSACPPPRRQDRAACGQTMLARGSTPLCSIHLDPGVFEGRAWPIRRRRCLAGGGLHAHGGRGSQGHGGLARRLDCTAQGRAGRLREPQRAVLREVDIRLPPQQPPLGARLARGDGGGGGGSSRPRRPAAGVARAAGGGPVRPRWRLARQHARVLHGVLRLALPRMRGGSGGRGTRPQSGVRLRGARGVSFTAVRGRGGAPVAARATCQPPFLGHVPGRRRRGW